jgi:polyribonucleotide nucleotidyltransferase
MSEKIVHEFNLQGVPFRLETGEIATHAQASFMTSYGETVVLVTVSVGNANPDLDFFPLTVDYQEKLYSSGYISSSPYIKREGRPSDKEILGGRLIDHAIRSLFPADFRNEVQVIAQVMSYDRKNDPLLASIIGVSFALSYSGVPFLGPYGATKVGFVNNEVVLNPLLDVEGNLLTMYVSSVENDGIVSVEAEAHNLSEEIIQEGIEKALELNNMLIQEQHNFITKNGKKTFEYTPIESKNTVFDEIKSKYGAKLEQAVYIQSKMHRTKAFAELKSSVMEEYKSKIESKEVSALEINVAFEKVIKKIFRAGVMQESRRPDGRALEEIRPLSMRVGVLPRVHGSALFTRGETQSLTIVTLGSERDAQQLQDINGEHAKRYFHHYNMPGYSNGEVDRRLGFASRRSIGHGTIGEKALESMIAPAEQFPYTIRVVSEITDSNGSTSMAATCASTLALMDAGVPVKEVIGGIGVGLVYEGEDNYKILTDIIGLEDFNGDMDFKITGSRDGITAIQLDNKMSGIPKKILFEAIAQSKKARLFVIDQMETCMTTSREQISKYAPRVQTIKINPEKIGELIGPGGKVIKGIIEQTGVEINIEDDGRVMIYSNDSEKFEKALQMVMMKTKELEVGQEYEVEVIRVESFGAIVEVVGTNFQGMVHVSNLGLGFVKDVHSVVKLGQKMKVTLIEKDDRGRMKFDVKSEENKDQGDVK